MERPHKRIRLDLADPSIYQEDGDSPFLDASNDMIDKIFRTLLAHGEKEKMLMEMVCRRLQSRIRQRSSWRGENKLELGQDEQNILINGYKFSFEKAPIALAKLLDRIQVENFILNDMPEIPLNVLLELCHTITRHKNYINMKRIHLLSNFDYSPIINALTGCGLENVDRLECGDWIKKYVQHLPPSFYSMLCQCRNLRNFILKIENLMSIWELLLPALADCHHIRELLIDYEHGVLITHQKAIEFAHLCSSNFPKLNTLCLGPMSTEFVPLEFVSALGEQLRSNLTYFEIELDSDIDSHWQFLVTFSNCFPKLKTLKLFCVGRFPTDTILETIGNIFSNYGRPGNNVYKFELTVVAENLGEVLSQLAQKRWNENDELVKIVASNGIWTCAKNNVEITLSLNVRFL